MSNCAFSMLCQVVVFSELHGMKNHYLWGLTEWMRLLHTFTRPEKKPSPPWPAQTAERDEDEQNSIASGNCGDASFFL